MLKVKARNIKRGDSVNLEGYQVVITEILTPKTITVNEILFITDNKSVPTYFTNPESLIESYE